MISYRDRSWCWASLDGRCTNETCPRYLTDADKAAARRWWGNEDPPIAWADLFDDCDERIEKESQP